MPPTGDSDEYYIGLPEADDVPELGSLLVRIFTDPLTPAQVSSPAPLETAEIAAWEIPEEVKAMPPSQQQRWHIACRGISWRVGSRLAQPSLASSLESSMLLAVRSSATSRLIACAELSLRPLDGRLPGEFAVPPLFQLHAAELGAYLSNLGVLPSHRRRGVASSLLRECERVVVEEWHMEELYLHINLRNPLLGRLYLQYQPLPEFDGLCQAQTDAATSPGAPSVQNRFHRKVCTGTPSAAPRDDDDCVSSTSVVAR